MRIFVIGLGLVAAAAAPALAAPTASQPPTITGTPAWGSTLTCKNGTWSADATGFAFSWAFAPSGPSLATGEQWKVDGAQGYRVVCVVTASDAAGASTTATSAPVVIGPGVTALSLKAKKTQSRKAVVITGRVGPADAVKDATRKTSVTVYRLGKGVLFQMTFNVLAKADGSFRAKFADTKGGKPTYQVQAAPANDRWQVVKKTIKVRLRR